MYIEVSSVRLKVGKREVEFTMEELLSLRDWMDESLILSDERKKNNFRRPERGDIEL